jgi:hypothetical protein
VHLLEPSVIYAYQCTLSLEFSLQNSQNKLHILIGLNASTNFRSEFPTPNPGTKFISVYVTKQFSRWYSQQCVDRSPLDLYLSGHLKPLGYSASIENEETLYQPILDACQIIRNHPGTCERVRQSMIRRVHMCIYSDGGGFEHLL